MLGIFGDLLADGVMLGGLHGPRRLHHGLAGIDMILEVGVAVLLLHDILHDIQGFGFNT